MSNTKLQGDQGPPGAPGPGQEEQIEYPPEYFPYKGEKVSKKVLPLLLLRIRSF